MVSEFAALSLADGALRASQLAIQTAGNNIANANTEGYSRQAVAQTESEPLTIPTAGRMPLGKLGTGVEVQAIQRMREELLDDQYRAQSATLGQLELRSQVLAQVERLAGEPSEYGLQAALDRFFDALEELGAHPESSSARSVLVAQAQSLAAALNDRDRQLVELQSQLDGDLARQGDLLNGLSRQIAELNRQIRQVPTGASPPNALLDERDRLLDQMARLAGVRSVERPDGTVAVLLGGFTIVDGDGVQPVAAIPGTGGFVHVVRATAPAAALPLGGEMGERIALRDGDLAGMRSDLDALAAALAQQVNALHQSGFGLDGSSGRAFFSGNTAATLGLDGAIAADPNRIAAAVTAAGVPGDGNNAMAMARLRNTPLLQGGTATFHDLYQGQVVRLAVRSQAARQDAERQDAVVAFLAGRREEVSGVSLDEEVAHLLRYQHAYAAAARFLTVVDELLDRLINQMGVVGR